jgi:predicted esterase
MKTKCILLVGLISIFGMLHAQTGSVSATISFNGADRNLACYIPKNYDSTKTYQLMICLHGLGDNSTNYRNALVNSLNWPALFPNTIFVCPDGGSDRNKDFYQPAGDEGIITAAISYGLNKYSINPKDIILQGFSLGGRSALKFGLDNPTKFSGLLLNTPAMQGLADLDNNPAASLIFNFSNAKLLPIYITAGEADYTYVSTVATLAKKLKRHNTAVYHSTIKSLGHSIPSNTSLKNCPAFFVQPNSNHFDADIFESITEFYACSNTLEPSILVRNNGDSTIYSFQLNLKSGNSSKTIEWKGSLLPNQHVSVKSPIVVSGFGKQKIEIKVSTINNGRTDADTLNNSIQVEIETPSDTKPSVINETFEGSEPAWSIKDNGGPFGWYLDSDVKRSGATSIGTFNTLLLFNTNGYKESFSSPILDISALSHKELSFDLAFNYLKYTPPYFTSETIFTDTLQVLISTDCGVTYTSLYKKWGKELATASEPILNPLSLAACFFTPKAEQWKKEAIDLSAFAQIKNAIIKFECISGMGGSLNIDNINLGSKSSGISVNEQSKSPVLYPNPANQVLNIQIAPGEKATVKIHDKSGKIVLEYLADESMATFDISQLSQGLYFVEITSANYNGFQKLNVVR